MQIRDRPPVRVQPIRRAATPMMAAGPIVEREVMGYLPYWEMDYDFPRWDLLTTVAWFGVEISASGDVVNWRGWPDNGDLVEEAHANGVRVVVTIVLFGKESIGELLLEPAHAQGRGYTPRACGFDLARDGSTGSPADCSVCRGDDRRNCE